MVRKILSLLLLATLIGIGLPARADEPIREVVGGDRAPAGEFPWVVRLSMGCGGALTAPDVVLTAGHCVRGTGSDRSIKVIAGVADLKSPDALAATSVRVVRAPGFVDETHGGDWALIKLDRALDLPTLPLTSGTGGDRGTFTIMGWGQTSETSFTPQRHLRYADVPAVDDQTCVKAYRKAGITVVADESLCAGKRGTDTCQGDSGGPMVRTNAEGRFVQVGIVSWGLGCARQGFPGVYTQISAFRTDIRKATKKLTG